MAFTTIDDPEEYFAAYLWTGDGTSPRSFTGVGFQSNMMWSKSRSQVHETSLVDTVRGVDGKRLMPDDDNNEDTTNSHGHFDSLDSDGFTITGAGGYHNVNTDTETYVGWFWKETATAGFDMVGYTGDGSARTISHSLSAVPHFMLVKSRTHDISWRVYHHQNTAAPATDYLELDNTTVTTDSATVWNDTTPTSSVFSVGSENNVNQDSTSLIAYLWSEKQGFSKFGTYLGNNNADGTFVYCGFKPAWVMFKATGSTQGWVVYDNKRDTFNPLENTFYVNTNEAESDFTGVDFCANGFKHRSAGGSHNYTGYTYIYIAFAEAPFVNSNGVPGNAR